MYIERISQILHTEQKNQISYFHNKLFRNTINPSDLCSSSSKSSNVETSTGLIRIAGTKWANARNNTAMHSRILLVSVKRFDLEFVA